MAQSDAPAGGVYECDTPTQPICDVHELLQPSKSKHAHLYVPAHADGLLAVRQKPTPISSKLRLELMPGCMADTMRSMFLLEVSAAAASSAARSRRRWWSRPIMSSVFFLENAVIPIHYACASSHPCARRARGESPVCP